jgi:hypothetical protein
MTSLSASSGGGLSAYVLDQLIAVTKYIYSYCGGMKITTPLEVTGTITADTGVIVPAGGIDVVGGLVVDELVTGSLQLSGNLTVGTITGTLLTASQPNITSLGPLNSLSLTGPIDAASWDLDILGNTVQSGMITASTLSVSGNSAIHGLTVTGNETCTGTISATNGFTGTLLTGAQPFITSLGSLSSLGVSGNITLSGSLYNSRTFLSYYRTTGQVIPNVVYTPLVFNASTFTAVGPTVFSISGTGTFTNISSKTLLVMVIFYNVWTTTSIAGIRISFIDASSTPTDVGFCQIGGSDTVVVSTTSVAVFPIPPNGFFTPTVYQNSGAAIATYAAGTVFPNLGVTVLASY